MFKTASDVTGNVPGFVREVLRSRVGLILFLLNFALISCAYAAAHGSFWTMLDPQDGSLPGLAAGFFNLPMLIATGLLTSPLLYERRVENFGVLQWVAVSFISFCVLFQWWVYGYLVERRQGKGNRPSPRPSP